MTTKEIHSPIAHILKTGVANRDNPVNAITNFINPGSAIAKSLILNVPLDNKINPVYAIHVIITI
jgi:hypothetical protein